MSGEEKRGEERRREGEERRDGEKEKRGETERRRREEKCIVETHPFPAANHTVKAPR